MCDEIRLVRYDQGETPWGFRITGGRDFGTPLLVVKVIGGSIAALAGVQVGDLVRGINYVPTNDFTHLDAQRAILESGDTLILNLLKGGEYELIQPPTLAVPEIPVIDIQSPEDKEVEEIGQHEPENLELSFMIKLDRSGRISAVEELMSPSTSPRSSPVPRTSSSSESEKRRKSSASSSHSEKASSVEDVGRSEKKPKISVTVGDSAINLQKNTNEVSGSKLKEKRKSVEQEVTLHEEMRMETSMKKTTTEIKERSEEEFITGVREQIIARAHNEKRELTDDEIAEMMTGEAEVLEGRKGKEVIGVNFQKFLPKCDFIKDSEVFKVLQEEQTKKEKSEEEQLERNPLKRFSKFLIKPKTEKPVPKPKPEQTAPMPWQLRLNCAAEKSANNTQEVSTGEKNNETNKASNELTRTEQEIETDISVVESRRSESNSVSILQESEEKLTLKVKSEKEEYNEVIRNREGEAEAEPAEDGFHETEDNKPAEDDEELENIDWENKEKSKSEKKRKESDELYVSRKRNSSDESRKSKTKKVAFVGLEFKENIEKQLAEIQKELLTLQQLPIEIQDHLLNVQRTLQDIVAQRSQMQSPENDEQTSGNDDNYDIDDNIGIFEQNDDGFDNIEELESEILVKQENETQESEEVVDVKISSDEVVESMTITMSETGEYKNGVSGKIQVSEGNETDKNESNESETTKDLPHGQEDVEMCVSTKKPALPLTPQMRPIVLPGGSKWHQPKDAYTEEYIAETLVSQSEVLVGTTIGVNFRKYIPPKFDGSNSAVYRLIQEIEERAKPKKGIAERPEIVHGLDEFYHPPIDKRHFYAAQLAVEKRHVDNLKTEMTRPPQH